MNKGSKKACGVDWKEPDPIEPYGVYHQWSKEPFRVIDECVCGEMIKIQGDTGPSKWVKAELYKKTKEG